jgi:hypothetical protein
MHRKYRENKNKNKTKKKKKKKKREESATEKKNSCSARDSNSDLIDGNDKFYP